MISMNLKLSLFLFIIIPFYLLLLVNVSHKIQKYTKEFQETKDNIMQESSENIQFHENILTFNILQKRKIRFTDCVIENGKKLKLALSYTNYINIVSGIIISFAGIGVLVLETSLVKRNLLSIVELIAFYSYASLFFSPVTGLLNLYTKNKTLAVYHDRIETYLTNLQKNSLDNNLEKILFLKVK